MQSDICPADKAYPAIAPTFRLSVVVPPLMVPVTRQLVK
jgi:hypothetical protein